VERLVQPDPGEDRLRPRIDCDSGNVLVPGAIVRQQPNAAEIGVRTELDVGLVLGNCTVD
jgi:hypothetical protein